MASHRMNCRRSGLRPDPAMTAGQVDPVASGVSVEEALVPDVDQLPKPAGFGTEVSTSATSSELIDEYVVPAQTLAEIVEVSVSLESNGQARLSVSGVSYGPYTGSADVSVPLEGSKLTEGSRVRVFHQSTDGSSTTTAAQVVALEV